MNINNIAQMQRSFAGTDNDAGQKTTVNEGSFGNILNDSIQKIDGLQKEADEAIISMASGKSNNIHETMIAIGKADLSFRMMMQVRNKITDAYQEVMRMAV